MEEMAKMKIKKFDQFMLIDEEGVERMNSVRQQIISGQSNILKSEIEDETVKSEPMES